VSGQGRWHTVLNVLDGDERLDAGVSLRCAPGRASRAVGNDTTVANGAGPPARRSSSRSLIHPCGRAGVPALRARIPHAWRLSGPAASIRRTTFGAILNDALNRGIRRSVPGGARAVRP